MTVDSTLGKGARFTCWIPYAIAQPEKPVDAIVSLPSQPARPLNNIPWTILVVEDNPIAQISVRCTLDKFGCQIEIAESGAQALAAVKQHTYDLILMDIGLPDFDGLEATRRIRAWENVHSKTTTPIVALTAHQLTTLKSDCLAAGMQAAINKPLTAEQVLTLLQQYCVDKHTLDATSPATHSTEKNKQPSYPQQVVTWASAAKSV